MLEQILKEIRSEPSELVNYMALADYLQENGNDFGTYLSKIIKEKEIKSWLQTDYWQEKSNQVQMLVYWLTSDTVYEYETKYIITRKTYRAFFFNGLNWFVRDFILENRYPETIQTINFNTHRIEVKDTYETVLYRKPLFYTANYYNLDIYNIDEIHIPLVTGALWASKCELHHGKTIPRNN